MALRRKPTTKTKETGPRYCVYLGPSIRGAVQNGAIIQGTRDEAVTQLTAVIRRYPAVKNLLVPDEELAAARVNIKKPGTALHEYHRRLSAALKSGK